MRRTTRATIASLVALPMLAMLGIPAVHAEERVEPASAPQSLSERLSDVVEAGASTPEAVAEELALPAEGGGSLTFDQAGRVTAVVSFESGPGDAQLAALAELSEIVEVLPLFRTVTVRVDPLSLESLERLPGVRGVTLAMQAFTSAELSGGGSAGSLAATAANSGVRLVNGGGTGDGDADDTGCRTVPVEADSPLRADLARAVFGIDGAGVTVGIISDSYDKVTLPTSAADDVLSGALPGPGNPCGYETPVTVVSQLPADQIMGSDEGRAMAQLVHGIAPGARILFADTGLHEAAMAQNIVELAEAGADIIVDDISYATEAYFQRGILSAAIELVKAEYGVTYFTSAGNSNGSISSDAGDLPISSWQTEAYRPMSCPTWLVQGENDPLDGVDPADFDCLDFDPGAAEHAYDTLFIAAAAEDDEQSDADNLEGTEGADDSDDADGPEPVMLRPIASIGEPLLGVTTSYQLRFYQVDQTDASAAPVPLALITSFGPASAAPGLFGAFEVDPGSELRMVVVRTGYDDSPDAFAPPVWLGFLRGAGSIVERQFSGDRTTDTVGPMTFGHGGDGSAISVASLDWRDTSIVRDYSSLGPATLWYEDYRLGDEAARPMLAAPETANTPNVAAVDGTATTFFGQDDGDGAHRFYGTSAAAPNAAAVAALALSSAPALTGAELSAHVLATARNSGPGAPVNTFAAPVADADVFGAGVVDAFGLLQAVAEAPEPASVPDFVAVPGAAAGSISISWSAAGLAAQPESYVLEVSDAAGSLAATSGGSGTPGAVASLPAVLASAVSGVPPVRLAAPAIVQTATLDSAAVTHTFIDLTPGTRYDVQIRAYVGGTVLASGTLSSVLATANGGGGGGGGTDTNPERGTGALSTTGSENVTPWIIGGAIALLVVAAGLIVWGLLRSRKRAAGATGGAGVAAEAGAVTAETGAAVTDGPEIGGGDPPAEGPVEIGDPEVR